MTDLIRWEPAPATEGGSYGFVATYGPAAFKVTPPSLFADECHWLLHVCIAPAAIFRYGETEADAKQQAETWLREFASSLGAVFPDDLREHLTEQAATEQELGDDYSDSPSPLAESQSHRHWGRAESSRDLIKYIDHELERTNA